MSDIPQPNYDSTGAQFERLVEIMRTLRSTDGCPWDREQTHATLKPYLLEEAYEALEAIDARNDDELCGELGDVLLQGIAARALELGSSANLLLHAPVPSAFLPRPLLLLLHPLVVVHHPLFHRAVRHVVDERHVVGVVRLERLQSHLLGLERRAIRHTSLKSYDLPAP